MTRSPRILGGIACALALALCGCAPAPTGASDAHWFGSVTPPRENVLRLNNGAEPETIDPSVMSGQPDGRIARMLFEGLTVNDAQTLQPEPGLAYRWENTPDGLTYTFHLRPGLQWSDGSPLGANDFVYAWRRVLTPATASRAASMLYPIAGAEDFNKGVTSDPNTIGVRAPDDSTLVVRLAQPTSFFVFLTAYYTYLPVPRATIERWGSAWLAPGHIVSNGPFVLTEHRQSEKIVMRRNPRYWDARHVALDGVIAYAVDDLNTSTNLYKSGAIDWNPSGYIPAPFLPYLRGYRDYLTGEFQATYFYSVNCARKPYTDPRVRRALALAIDRESITRDLLKRTRRAWGRITPDGYPGYPAPAQIPYDPQRARALLAEAGFPGGRGFPKLRILFNTSEDHRRIAEAIQAMWRRDLGIDVELQNMEWASYLQATTSLDYDVARRSWIGDYLDPLTFLGMLRTGDGNNRTGWSNARYDALLRAADAEVDATKRLGLLAQAEALALDESPFLPIYHYTTHELVKPYVKGIYHTALDFHPLKRVYIDRDWREHDPIAEGAR